MSKAPTGLTVLAVIIGLGSLYSIRVIARHDSHMFFFGLLFNGLPFKLYYAAIATVNLAIAVGLVCQHRFAYIGFLVLSSYSFIIVLGNIFLVDADVLAEAGWTLAENSLQAYRGVQGFGILMILVMVTWLFSYRKRFRVSETTGCC